MWASSKPFALHYMILINHIAPIRAVIALLERAEP